MNMAKQKYNLNVFCLHIFENISKKKSTKLQINSEFFSDFCQRNKLQNLSLNSQNLHSFSRSRETVFQETNDNKYLSEIFACSLGLANTSTLIFFTVFQSSEHLHCSTNIVVHKSVTEHSTKISTKGSIQMSPNYP